MSQCCRPPLSSTKTSFTCPQGNCRGKPIQLITLKSLLKPAALECLDSCNDYRFCDTPECPVVYFSNQGNAFTVQDLKVSVFQKDKRDDVPVCYCFGWTRQRIQSEMEWSENPQVVKTITTHIKAKRCGCEVNNPKGSCCLANVRSVIVDYRHPDSH